MSHSRGRLCKPWLWLPSNWAHDLGPSILPIIARLTPTFDNKWQPLSFKNINFANPLGIAGGVDKSGKTLPAWKKLGAGFLEVGTVTPEPQKANPGKIMDRDIERQALWNKMGFPNAGAEKLLERLRKWERRETPLFINIGKNRWTSNADAHKDYAHCVKMLHPYADAFVVNLSSPNTKGLRDLLSESELVGFLSSFFRELGALADDNVFLLKLSPDMDDETLKMVLTHSFDYVDGWILTNTTKRREPETKFPMTEGGVSGLPVQPFSRQSLAIAAEFLKPFSEKKLLVSVGGVDTAEEVSLRLKMGADLVQAYSALVFEGPSFFKNTINSLRNSKA